MDPLLRDRGLLLSRRAAAVRRGAFGLLVALGAAGIVAACARPSANLPVGVSTAGHSVGGGASSDAGVRGDADVPANFRTGFHRLNKARFVSNGHAAGRFEVDVYANDVAQGAGGTGDFPAGARWIKEHFERAPDGGSSRGPIMMMEKMAKGFDPEHGDFRYVVITVGGDIALDGPSESCAGCHDDAPRDHVFAIP